VRSAPGIAPRHGRCRRRGRGRLGFHGGGEVTEARKKRVADRLSHLDAAAVGDGDVRRQRRGHGCLGSHLGGGVDQARVVRAAQRAERHDEAVAEDADLVCRMLVF